MSRSESWKTWGAIIGILIVFGLLAALWPAIISLDFLSLAGGGTAVARETETFVLVPPPLPFLPAIEPITLSGFQAIIILAVIVVGVVAVTGLIIGLINLFLSRQATSVEASESYQEKSAALEKKEKARLSEKQEGRPAAPSQQRDYSRWAVVATSLTVLMFAIFFGFLVSSALFPGGQIIRQDTIVNITAIIAGAFALITLLILLLRMDRERLSAVEETDYSGIPWDTIAIILTGVLVVGLGIGLLLYFNVPL